GLAFVLPGFLVLLALTMGYAALGVTPILRGALHGLGPVVLGIYLVAVYRLGRAALTSRWQVVMAIAATIAALATPVGIVSLLLLAGGVGLWLFHSRKLGVAILVPLAACLLILHVVARSASGALPAPAAADTPASLAQIGLFLLEVGAFTFGGGLSMIALIQERVVSQAHWLTPQEFIDGLALGQLTPGPVLMVAAYIGYKVAGLAGAVIGAVAAFLPSFVMMLAILPALEQARSLVWPRAARRGISPAVIGVLAVSLVRLAPHAVPDVFALLTLAATVVVLMVWRVTTMKVMLGGAVLRIARSPLLALPVTRSLLSTVTRS